MRKGLDLNPKKAPQRRLVCLSDGTLDKVQLLSNGDDGCILFPQAESVIGR